MKKAAVLLVVLCLVTVKAFAFDASYFHKFLNTELTVTYNYGDSQKTEVIYLTSIDFANGTLVGKTNSGLLHVEIQNITLVREGRPDWHAIYNY